MTQLRLGLRATNPDRVAAVFRVAAEEGWERDPTAQAGKERWRLPGTAWYVRANWHTTTVYRLVDGGSQQRQSVESEALGLVRMLFQRTRLEARRSVGRRG